MNEFRCAEGLHHSSWSSSYWSIYIFRNIRIVLGVCCTQLIYPKSRSRFIRFIMVDDDRTPDISQSSLTVGEYPLFSMNVLILQRTSFCFVVSVFWTIRNLLIDILSFLYISFTYRNITLITLDCKWNLLHYINIVDIFIDIQYLLWYNEDTLVGENEILER